MTARPWTIRVRYEDTLGRDSLRASAIVRAVLEGFSVKNARMRSVNVKNMPFGARVEEVKEQSWLRVAVRT